MGMGLAQLSSGDCFLKTRTHQKEFLLGITSEATHEPGFQMLFDLIEEPLLRLSAEGRITAANQAALRLLGRSSQQVRDAHFDKLLFPWAELGTMQGAQFATTRRLSLAGRQAKRYSLRFYRLPNSLESATWLLYLKDEDANWRLEQEREKLMALASLNDILPTFLHELKNPLASVMAISELALEDLPEGETREAMQAIFQETMRMKLAFEGLGNLSRNLRCQEEQDIATAITDACAIFRPLFDRLQIKLAVELEPIPPLHLQVAAIRGMLFNLLTNAKQACKAGDTVRVSGKIDQHNQVFQFVVSDTGIGMPPEVAANCTELFFTTKPMGSGIGMALCRSALTQLNGTLNIDSEPGKGTRVTAVIPLGERSSDS